MNKKIKRFQLFVFLIMVAFTPGFASGQDNGIRFETGISWHEILKKAKTENKYVFVDCYTTWCGPCKWMSKNIFTQKEVGDYFNAHFINVAVQMDRTPKDSQTVKDWYEDAKILSDKYEISSYPTYLFFSPEGIAVHHVIGSTKDAAEFITKGTDALDSNKQYYTKINNLSSHYKDSAFLYKAINDAVIISDTAGVKRIGEYYIKSQNNLFTNDNLWVISWLVELENNSGGVWFSFCQKNSSKINEFKNQPSFVAKILVPVIVKERVEGSFKNGIFPIDFKIISANIRTEYPDLGESLIQEMRPYFKNFIADEINKTVNSSAPNVKVNWNAIKIEMHHKIRGFDIAPILLNEEVRYWARKKSWTQCADKSYELINKYGDSLGAYSMNNICWYNIFLHCDDKKILNESLKWMKYYIDLDPNDQVYIDTYANLLFKTGNTAEAIKWEKKAMILAEENVLDYPQDVSLFKATVKKMEAGIPTWPEDTSKTN